MPTFIEDDVKTFAAFEGKYLKGENKVVGVSLIQKGPAIGHGVWVDDTSLLQLKQACDQAGRVRVKTDHFTGIAETIGYAENFRVSAGKVQADLSFYDSSPSAPLMREMIETVPGTFGISIAFVPDKPEYSKDKDRYSVRIKDILSADFVDRPAANATGVFSEGQEIDNSQKLKMEEELKAKIAELEKFSADLQEQLSAANQRANDLKAQVESFESKEAQGTDKVSALESQLSELSALVKAMAAAPEPKKSAAAPPNEEDTEDGFITRKQFDAMSQVERNQFFAKGGKLKA
jgi:hypothetical protein